jgi:hypothetical protein
MAKVGSQSSKHGVIATDNIVQLSSSFSVERQVRFLGDPDAMEQDGQLPRHGNNSLALGLLATSSCQMQALQSECRVPAMSSQDMVGTLDQKTSEIDVPSLGNAELWVSCAGLTAPRS